MRVSADRRRTVYWAAHCLLGGAGHAAGADGSRGKNAQQIEDWPIEHCQTHRPSATVCATAA
jgi:hypothetical protein